MMAGDGGSGRKKAVALRYDPGRETAPVVVGKGLGLLAEKIIAIAREHNIPVHEDSDLVEVLSRISLFEEIPPEAYLVVAEILAFVYQTNQSYEKR